MIFVKIETIIGENMAAIATSADNLTVAQLQRIRAISGLSVLDFAKAIQTASSWYCRICKGDPNTLLTDNFSFRVEGFIKTLFEDPVLWNTFDLFISRYLEDAGINNENGDKFKKSRVYKTLIQGLNDGSLSKLLDLISESFKDKYDLKGNEQFDVFKIPSFVKFYKLTEKNNVSIEEFLKDPKKFEIIYATLPSLKLTIDDIKMFTNENFVESIKNCKSKRISKISELLSKQNTNTEALKDLDAELLD